MKWDRIVDVDAVEWLECDLGRIGLLCVDNASGPFVAVWVRGGEEAVIGSAATEAEAKEAARDWLRLVIAQLGNVAAMGEQREDDGA